MENKQETKSYEERLSRLDEIVAKIEGEVLPLNETMALFEEANVLLDGLQKELEEAKLKIEEITSKGRTEVEE